MVRSTRAKHTGGQDAISFVFLASLHMIKSTGMTSMPRVKIRISRTFFKAGYGSEHQSEAAGRSTRAKHNTGTQVRRCILISYAEVRGDMTFKTYPSYCRNHLHGNTKDFDRKIPHLYFGHGHSYKMPNFQLHYYPIPTVPQTLDICRDRSRPTSNFLQCAVTVPIIGSWDPWVQGWSSAPSGVARPLLPLGPAPSRGHLFKKIPRLSNNCISLAPKRNPGTGSYNRV